MRLKLRAKNVKGNDRMINVSAKILSTKRFAVLTGGRNPQKGLFKVLFGVLLMVIYLLMTLQ